MYAPIVGFAVKRIGDFLIEEALFLWHMKAEVERLQNELLRMECFLEDAESKREQAGVNHWVSEVRKVSYETEDLIETFVLEEEKKQQSFEGKCISYSCCLRQMWRRDKFGRNIELLWKKIDDITKGAERYKFANVSVVKGGRMNAAAKVALRRQANLHDESKVVGMDDEKNAILHLLLSDKNESRLSVVSIVGMGGLGKTTLAKKVFKHGLIKRFDLAVWVDVSQQYTADDLLRDLYKEVSKVSKKAVEEVEKMARNDVAKSLHESLRGKKYLIVMDDVWDGEVWKILEPHLPCDKNGSRILITTRDSTVGKAATLPCAPYKLRFLNQEESWALFLSKAYPGGDGEVSCKGVFKEEGKKIVGNCGGLPLALVVVGGLLSQKEGIEDWEKIGRTVVWNQNEEGKVCMDILALSYADLPQNLKWCFLYLGAFPEDFKISVPKLLRLWIAEGFVEVEHGLTLEEVAEQYLEDFIFRCLLQVSEDPTTHMIQCRIHDLLRELAIKQSKELGFLHYQRKTSQDNQNGLDYSTMRRLSLHTLPEFLSQRRSNHCLRTVCRMQLIRVIDLEGAPITLLPNQIGELANLRYLGLRKTDIKSLPSSIQKLTRLQTIDVDVTGLKELNSAIWKIKTLRQVIVSPSTKLPGIHQGSLHNLQVLETPAAGDWITNNLSNLTNLQTLRLAGIQESHQHELSSALEKLSHLATLALQGNSIPGISLSLSNRDNLHSLLLDGRIQCPINFSYAWPARLTKLFLLGTMLGTDPLPSLGELSALRVLLLADYSYNGTEMVSPRDSFPKLQKLNIVKLYRLENWILEDRAMPYLRSLRISNCKNMMNLPQGLRNLVKVEELFLSGVSRTIKASVDEKDGEDWENIQHIPSITIDGARIIREELSQESNPKSEETSPSNQSSTSAEHVEPSWQL